MEVRCEKNALPQVAPRRRPERTLAPSAPPPSILLSSPPSPASATGQSPRVAGGGGLFLTRAYEALRGADTAGGGALRGVGDSVQRRGGKAWRRWF
jgi:hypothetical protein